MEIQITLESKDIIESLFEYGEIGEIIKDEEFGAYFKDNMIIYLSHKDLSLNIISCENKKGQKGWLVKYEIEDVLNIFNEDYWDTDTPEEIDNLILGLGVLLEKLKDTRDALKKKPL